MHTTSILLAMVGIWLLSETPSLAQTKEDLLGGTPVDSQSVYAQVQQPHVANALAACGAGKLSAGSVSITISITPAGKASLVSTNPALPPDISGCLGGVVGSVAMPSSGSGGQVSFVFNFPATPPPTAAQPKPFDVRFTPEYQKAWRTKKAGLGLLIPGCIITGLGAMAMAIVLSTEHPDDEGVRATVGMTVVGLVLLIPGAVLVGIANKGLQEALVKYNAMFPLPGIALDPVTRTASITLSWRL